MRERDVVWLAAAVWVGARLARLLALPHGRPVLLGLVCGVVLCLRLGWRAPAVGLACALAAVLGARSWAGLDPPASTVRWSGTATLVSDPVRVGAGWKAELRLAGGARTEAFAHGAPARVLRDRLSGERITGTGRLRAPPAAARERLAHRHVASRLTLTGCSMSDGGAPWALAANGLRRTLVDGASSLAPERRALWTGLVFGDDRDEDPGVTADFSAAGLTHLLAVSGQNVAFALAAAGPLLRRLGLRSRLLAGLLVLGLFGVAVRFEPSVLRATAMAALALVATTLGVGSSSIRLVAVAVAGLVLVDPLLVHRLGFQLSVAATVGIALWSRPLAERLRGPAFLRESLATALAAQAAVAPLLLGLGGTSPVSVPANVLAAPAAGPVMVWGLTAGTVAGLLGGPVATVLHLPDQVLLRWLAGVAHVAARVPLRPVGAVALLLTGLLVVGAVFVRARRRGLVVAAALVFVVPDALPGPAVLDGVGGATGVALWRRDGTTVAVLAPGDPARVLTALRRSGVGRIDVVAVDGTGPAVLAVLAAVLDRHDVVVLVGARPLDVAGLQPLDPSRPVRAGPFTVGVDADGHPAVEVA